MVVAIDITPDDPIATKSVTRIDVTGTDTNDDSAFDNANYPASPEMRYYLAFEVDGEEMGRSQVFGTSPVGAFQFNGYIFPTAGSYDVVLYDASDNSEVETQSVTVSAP